MPEASNISLVTSGLSLGVGICFILLCIVLPRWDLIHIAVGSVALCAASWFALRTSSEAVTKLGLDVTLLRYLASLSVWACFGMMLYCIARSFELATVHPGAAVMTTLSIAFGLGAQPILSNFGAGCILVLFRPFRVGDVVNLGGHMVTIHSITAFFTHTETLNETHRSYPNSKVLEENSIENMSCNRFVIHYLPVYVRSKGRKPCEIVRRALSAAAVSFEAGIGNILEENGVKSLAGGGKAKVLGPSKITSRGAEWSLMITVPSDAYFPARDFGYAQMLDSLQKHDIDIYEGPE